MCHSRDIPNYKRPCSNLLVVRNFPKIAFRNFPRIYCNFLKAPVGVPAPQLTSIHAI